MSLFDARVDRDPVRFPRLTPIVRKRLFKTNRSRRDVGDYKANKDQPAIHAWRVTEIVKNYLIPIIWARYAA